MFNNYKNKKSLFRGGGSSFNPKVEEPIENFFAPEEEVRKPKKISQYLPGERLLLKLSKDNKKAKRKEK